MARRIGIVPLFLCVGLYYAFATAQTNDATPLEGIELNKELERLRGWKTYLTAEVDKHKAELETAQKRTAELNTLVEQLKQSSAAAESRATEADTKATAAEAKVAIAEAKAAEAEAKATAAEAKATAAEAKAIAAEAKATAAEANAAAAEAKATAAEAKATAAEAKATAAEANVAEVKAMAAEAKATAAEAKTAEMAQLTAQVDELKKDAETAKDGASAAEARATEAANKVEQLKTNLAAAESRASAHAAAADASNGEAALLRKQYAAVVAERQALNDRVIELAKAAAKDGGLRGHTRAIYKILLEEVARHYDNALNYANEKLPGFKAKVTKVHAIVSSKIPNVTGHVGKFVNTVEGELRPWLRQTLGPVNALRPYSEDPVVLQGLTYFIIGAPVLILVIPLLSITFRLFTRRPRSSSVLGRGFEPRSSRRNKKKLG